MGPEDAHKYWARKAAAAGGEAAGGFQQPGTGWGEHHVTSPAEAQEDTNRSHERAAAMASAAHAGGGMGDIQAAAHLGTPSGFYNTGGSRTMGNARDPMYQARLAAERAKTTEPTSFRGGAGAPAPVEIVGRGFVNPEGGPEYGTPQQAGQAWNEKARGQFLAANPTNPRITYPGGSSPEDQAAAQYGSFRPAGTSLEETKGRFHLAAAEATGKAHVAAAEAAGKSPYYEGMGNLAKEQAQAAKDARTTKENAENFRNWLHESPYSTYDSKTGKMAFTPKDEAQARDAKAAENVAHTQGFEAAKQHFGDRQLARQWLTTQPLPAEFDSHSYLAAVASDPRAWAELMGKARASGVRPGPAAPRPLSWLGTTQLQGEAPFVAPAPPVVPTQPPERLRSLTESMTE